MNHVQRAARVIFFALLASLMVWRANSYTDPAGFTGVPQVFLCLMGLLFGFAAFSIGLGLGDAEAEAD